MENDNTAGTGICPPWHKLSDCTGTVVLHLVLKYYSFVDGNLCTQEPQVPRNHGRPRLFARKGFETFNGGDNRMVPHAKFYLT